MARINIEDSLFKDKRWLKLIIKTGCEHKALGMVTSAWILAQENWLKYGCIPEKAWPKDLEILIEVELATRRENGTVYVKGSAKAFSWLNQKSEAGRKSGLTRVKNSNAIKQQTTATDVERESTESNGSEPHSLSHSLSHSLTHSLSLNSNSKLEKPLSTEPKKLVTVATTKIKIKISDSKTIEVNKDLVSSWADTYPKDFLNDELKKARNWVLSNPHKAPKAQWGKFLNNWFNRSWDRYRTTLKSNPIKVTMEDLNEVLGGL